MGYATYYSLNIYTDHTEDYQKVIPEDKYNEIRKELDEFISEKEGHDYFTFDEETHHWNNIDQEISEFSLRYPELWFFVYGDGDDQGDEHRHVYHNGKYETIGLPRIWPEIDLKIFKENGQTNETRTTPE